MAMQVVQTAGCGSMSSSWCMGACMQAAQRIADGVGASASSIADRLGSSGGADVSKLHNMEPHYGAHAAQRAAQSLLEWLHGQWLGPVGSSSLGGAGSQQLSEYFPQHLCIFARVLACWAKHKEPMSC